MRRSQAPSFRNALRAKVVQTPVRTTTDLLKIVENPTGETTPNVTENISIHDTVQTNINVKTVPKTKQTHPNDTSNEKPLKENVVQNNRNTLVYNVLWGKKSTKKHKTWEDDGILEIVNDSATLKDLSGKTIGSVANVKRELIEEGYILSVGSKEVQILELAANIVASEKRRPEEQPECRTHVNKKVKGNSTLPNFLTKKNSIQKIEINENSLVMPEPSAAHQWFHNENKRIVTQVVVDNFLTKVLRNHQKIGVLFLYECVMGYKQENCYGAILADEMGLGKTLQCITLIWILLKQGPYGGIPVVRKVLIITPSSLIGNWQKEFTRWLGSIRIQIFIVDAKNKAKDYVKHPVPVLIMSYEMFVRTYSHLENIKFDLLICDEGHRLKNNSIKVSSLLSQFECKRKIILSGTPIQNDLQEFYSLVDFVNPGYLGSSAEYRKNYEIPIIASRHPGAPEEVRKNGEEKAAELNKKTSHFILRRTQDILDKYLPTKTEAVIFCKSTELQRNLYTTAVEFWENREVSSKDVAHLSVITALKKICNHPSLVWKAKSTTEHCEINLINKLCQLFSNQNSISFENSGKMKLLKELLVNLKRLQDKIVIVSSYTQTLDLIMKLCENNHYKYSRLDGSTPSQQRTQLVENFNNSYSDVFVFLLSAKAGGVGINLIGASRLVLFDSDWNPATDLQAMARVWRDGQKKSVYIYRFLTTGTIEEKIYQRQISKTGLSGTVVDRNSTNSIRMSDEELKDLFSQQFDALSTTHSTLNCKCTCSGEIPEIKKTEPEQIQERTCQLGVQKKCENSQNTRVDQLMQWEHHASPFDNSMLCDLALNNSSDITFIFRNKVAIK